jgi:hypothetical protein
LKLPNKDGFSFNQWQGKKIMPESRSKKIAANRIAKNLKAEYIPGPGPDIKSSKVTIAVETEETLSDALRKLSGYRGPVYVAVTTKTALYAAIEKYAHTTIGVMDNQGDIVKKSTRKKKDKSV